MHTSLIFLAPSIFYPEGYHVEVCFRTVRFLRWFDFWWEGAQQAQEQDKEEKLGICNIGDSFRRVGAHSGVWEREQPRQAGVD